MRMSCNGCRVLRKGCNENCSIRPCLQWIKSPESQANATVFLAKFYGRAGLMNLINAGPDHLRPAIFRSLLYESCGRMVNPIYGSVGLLWSGQWNLCQAAVEAVLKGAPITPIPTEAAANPPPVKGAYDIRHVMTKDEASNNSDSAELHQTKPVRTRSRRTGGVVKPKPTKLSSAAAAAALAMMADRGEMNGSSTSHDSSVSHPDEASGDTNSNGNSCMASAETMEEEDVAERGNGLELELTLGFGMGEMKSCMVRQGSSEVEDDVSCRVELGLF